jgi:hypothetical protein
VGDDLLTIDSLRKLMPPYRGPAFRLFRGDSLLNRRRRTSGLAWSTSRDTARKHAHENKHGMARGGSVLLETLAPAEAIITTSHLLNDTTAKKNTWSTGDYFDQSSWWRDIGKCPSLRAAATVQNSGMDRAAIRPPGAT